MFALFSGRKEIPVVHYIMQFLRAFMINRSEV